MMEEQKNAEFVSFDGSTPPSKDLLTAPIDPDAPHWNALGAFGFWLFSLSVMVAVVLLAVFGYAAVIGLPSAQLKDLASDPTANIIQIAANLPIHLIWVLAAWALITRGGKQSFWRTIGWSWNGFGIWACVGTTVAVYSVVYVIGSLVGEQENELTRLLASSRTISLIVAFIAVFTAPFAEEIVYRGVLYPGLKKSFGAPAGVILVAVLFTAIHVPQYVDSDKIYNLSSYGTISIIALLSLILTLIRARTASLLPCFVIHTLFNGVGAVLIIARPYLESIAPVPPAP